MFKFQRQGYKSKNTAVDLMLGCADGVDNALWAYVYASILFAGTVSSFISVGVLAVLSGWILLRLFVSLTSKEPLHIANLDDQAVVIFGAVSLELFSGMNSTDESHDVLVTILAMMGLTSFIFALSSYFVGRYKLSRMLELLPFPVICGFMASLGWLLIDAGFKVSTGSFISWETLTSSVEFSSSYLLWISFFSGLVLTLLMIKSDKFWLVPLSLAGVVALYYGYMHFQGISQEEQLMKGWLFEANREEGESLVVFSRMSSENVDWYFIFSALPEIITIVILGLLYSSMTLATLNVNSSEELDVSEEFKVIGGANLFCVATCSPPGYTDVVTSRMYQEFGASSRWMPLSSAIVSLVILLMGSSLIMYLPKFLVTIGIFLFAFQTLYEWLWIRSKGFSKSDVTVVFIILATVMFSGFMHGILIGIFLTVILFVVRYSLLKVIALRQTLREVRSSVERSYSCNEKLSEMGDEAIIFQLRGYLFFGSANRVLEAVLEEVSGEGRCRILLMDMKQVSGMDVSALNKFSQIKKLCDNNHLQLIYSSVPANLQAKLVQFHAVADDNLGNSLFDERDFALEYMEDSLLGKQALEALSIEEILDALMKDEDKAQKVFLSLEKRCLAAGEIIFEQGDINDGFYIVESGALEASVRQREVKMRVKKFRPGALLGELSAYLAEQKRTATVTAAEESVIYHFRADKHGFNGDESLSASIHELLARALAERVNYMNHRLLANS